MSHPPARMAPFMARMAPLSARMALWAHMVPFRVSSPAGLSAPRRSRLPTRSRPPITALAVLLALATGLSVQPVLGASGLLDTVKANPALARSLCDRFRALNKGGQSATSAQSIAQVASEQGLPPLDAEVLITYVIGLHCPEVR